MSPDLPAGLAVEVYDGEPDEPKDFFPLLDELMMERFLDVIDDPDADIAPETPPQFRISDLRVTGDIASAKLIFEPAGVQTMYFRKEAGAWTVCAAAEDQM